MFTHRILALILAFLIVGGPIVLLAWLVRLNFPNTFRPRAKEPDPRDTPAPDPS